LKAYLLRSVRNACLDELRHQTVIHVHEAYAAVTENLLNDVDTEHYILYSELQKYFHKALRQMPEACREAFMLSRDEGLRYHEIAERLHVSVRTIEVRMSKALEMLRVHLKEFFLLFLLWGIH
jgi:RNA polymerase sigma-70 factor (ECF subfamily)